MEYTFTIPAKSTAEFLRRLKAQCAPFKFGYSFFADGNLYGSVQGDRFALYTAQGKCASYLEGSVDDRGTVSFAFRTTKGSQLCSWLLHGSMAICLVASILQDGFSVFHILVPIIYIPLMVVCHFEALQLSERNGNRLIHLIEQTARRNHTKVGGDDLLDRLEPHRRGD
jgi:hypothetical protein